MCVLVDHCPHESSCVVLWFRFTMHFTPKPHLSNSVAKSPDTPPALRKEPGDHSRKCKDAESENSTRNSRLGQRPHQWPVKAKRAPNQFAVQQKGARCGDVRPASRTDASRASLRPNWQWFMFSLEYNGSLAPPRRTKIRCK